MEQPGVHPIPTEVWKIFRQGNVPSQLRNNTGTLLGNFYSVTYKELYPLSIGNISLR
jgi:hypothetical protein